MLWRKWLTERLCLRRSETEPNLCSLTFFSVRNPIATRQMVAPKKAMMEDTRSKLYKSRWQPTIKVFCNSLVPSGGHPDFGSPRDLITVSHGWNIQHCSRFIYIESQPAWMVSTNLPKFNVLNLYFIHAPI